MVKTYSIRLSAIAKEKSSRFDVDFLALQFAVLHDQSVNFGDFFTLVEKGKILAPDEFYYCEIGHVDNTGEVSPILLNVEERNELNENFFKKIEKGDIIKPSIGDVLISSVRPNLKKIVFIDEEKSNIFFTKAFIHLRPKKHALISYYLLRTIFFAHLISVSRQGKGYPTLNSNDLFLLKFDRTNVNNIVMNVDVILPEIQRIKQEINQLRSILVQPQEIIDNIFSREFRYDVNELTKAKAKKLNSLRLSDFGRNEDLRFGFRFHNVGGKTVMDIMQRLTKKRICDFLSEPIKLGASISPDFYDDECGEAYYLTMATIKNWKFESEGAKKVNKLYWANEKNKNSIRKGDLIIARSGEGTIGKVAIIEDDEYEAIFCDFTMRIRLNNYNPAFAYYYLRTSLFQTLIETHKKGLGNNTNIFPKQIKELPLIDIQLDRQKEIVAIIRNALNKQEKYKTEIKRKHDEMERIIARYVYAIENVSS